MRRLGLVLLLAGVAVPQPAEGPVVRCATGPAARAPRVDGELSEEIWREAPAYVIDARDHIHPQYREGWTGPEDLSGRVRAVLVAEHLYLAIEVRDEATLHAPGRAWWAGDSIEVFFDTDRESGEEGDRYSNDDLQLFLMPFHAGPRWGVVARGPDVPYPDGGLRGIELAHSRRPEGYAIEVRIPLWNLEPLRPDARGRIGFDVALNDVDSPDATQAETYMTLSGRFDLHSTPANFADLEIGPCAPAPAPETGAAVPAVDWVGLLLGLLAVALLAYAVRGATRRMAKRAHVKTATLCGIFAAAAVLCSFLPTIAALLDDRATRRHWGAALQQAAAAAATHLDLDTGDDDKRAERLVALLRDGRVRIRPHYRFGFVPLAASPPPPGRVRYGIRLGPGEVRRFPFSGRRAPQRLRLDLNVPEPDERGTAAGAEVRLEFEEGAPVVVEAPRRPVAPVLMDTSDRAGEPMRELVIRNRLLSGVLVVDACFGETAKRDWQPVPLAFVARAGVPLDVWHGRPATHILPVPRGGTAVRPVDLAGHRLWIAVGAEGAYPATPYGAEVAVVKVVYAQGHPGPELRLVNGRDLESRLLSYGRIAQAPDSIALLWEDSVRRPELLTLHSLEVDPTRAIARIEISDLGVLEALRVAAVTVGHRIAEAPPSRTGLRLDEDLLIVRDEVRRAWDGLGFAVRSPAGTMRSVGPPHEVRAEYALPFGDHERGALEVRMPHVSSTWSAVTRYRSLVFGFAALLLTFAAVVAGAALLYRARHLRVKMLAALAAATIAPLLFLVVSLSHVLTDAAEGELREMTLTDLHQLEERLAATASRARELAASVRDTLELVPPDDPEVLRRHVDRSRMEIEAQGGFLRLPDLASQEPSALGNVAFFDALSRPGLYYSPWDGLVALGLARTGAQLRCLVGLPAPRLVGPPRSEVTAALYGPHGEPLAATGGAVRELESTAALGRQRGRLDRLTRTGEPLYEARTTLHGREVATAHALLQDGGKVVGLLGVYRSRAATESRKAEVLRTLLLSTLAAVLLVVLAGGTLVERVTERLQRVTQATREIARGRLESRAPVESEDEVGRLAASFNTMADALDRRVRQLTDLQRGLQELTAALDRDAVAQAAADLLARATGARRIEIVALEPATDRLETLHRLGEGVPLGPHLPASGPAREAVEAQRPVAREGALVLPLVAADRTVGLAICSPFTEAPEAFLDLTARQIGIALENARLYRAAVTDELTGVYTRPFFVRRLKEEVDRAAATGRPLSLLRIVLADYGTLVRRYGAAAAAKATAESVAVIGRTLPPRNIVACGQPGELLCLLVESDDDDARARLDRIAAALQRHAFEVRPTFAYRSVSYPRDGAAADILLDALHEATETLQEAPADAGPLVRVPPGLAFVPSRSPTMRAALEVVARVAPTNATVLLSGETGTGKEILADLIQANSGRRDQPYVKVNCAAIPDTLVETELFGHERGAFTGADRRRIGRFEQAHRGTLFLDEVGDLPLPTQVKLLRTLQERRIQRVGSSQPLDVDVRILAATNRDLGAAVRRGAFREDLYHRVHVIELRVPPLRERREDIPDLIDGFLRELNVRHGLQVEAFAPDVLDALYRHAWPGNIRELRNLVERSMLLAAARVVERQHVALPEEPARDTGRRVMVEGLTPRQERVLAYARERGGVTNGEIVEEERISARTALRELQKLVDRGLLARVGRRRGAVYRPT